MKQFVVTHGIGGRYFQTTSLESAEAEAGKMAKQHPGDEITILAPVSVWQCRVGDPVVKRWAD